MAAAVRVEIGHLTDDLVITAVAGTGAHGLVCGGFDRVLADQNQRTAAVVTTAVQFVQWCGHQSRTQNVVDGDRIAIHRKGIACGVIAGGDCDAGQLFACRSVLMHMTLGGKGIEDTMLTPNGSSYCWANGEVGIAIPVPDVRPFDEHIVDPYVISATSIRYD